MNMGIILLISPPIEKSLGRSKFTILFLVSIILCGLTILIFSRECGVGASGFDFGLFGMYLSIMIFKKDMIDKQSKIPILFLIVFVWLFTFINKDVSIAGHFGGFIAGIIIGAFFIYTNGLKPFYYKEQNLSSTNIPQ
jgi:rhomboid protease GluP